MQPKILMQMQIRANERDESFTGSAYENSSSSSEENITVRGKNGCLCNIFGSDTVEQSQPRTEDRHADTHPQHQTYFNVE